MQGCCCGVKAFDGFKQRPRFGDALGLAALELADRGALVESVEGLYKAVSAALVWLAWPQTGSEAELRRARAALKLAGVRSVELRDRVEFEDGAVSTIHFAKGLEFRSVATMACDDVVIPPVDFLFGPAAGDWSRP